jgi:hypothetical protein
VLQGEQSEGVHGAGSVEELEAGEEEEGYTSWGRCGHLGRVVVGIGLIDLVETNLDLDVDVVPETTFLLPHWRGFFYLYSSA